MQPNTIAVYVSIPNHSPTDRLFKPLLKKMFEVDKSLNLQEVLNVVRNKYPNFISFYYKGLIVQKQQ